MNTLFEPFHCWAATQPVGVPVLDLRVASASFADDLVLLGTSLAETVLLVDAYQRWCRLLDSQSLTGWPAPGRVGRTDSRGSSALADRHPSPSAVWL